MALKPRIFLGHFQKFGNLVLLTTFICNHSRACNIFHSLKHELETSQCTVLLSLQEGNIQDINYGFNIDLFSTICVTRSSIRANPEKTLRLMSYRTFRRLFSRLKFTSDCMFLLISPGRLSTSVKIDFTHPTTASVNLAAAIFSPQWKYGLKHDSYYGGMVVPTALICFSYQRRLTTNYNWENSHYYVTLPSYMPITKVLVFVFTSPVVSCKLRNKFIILHGCSWCDKTVALKSEKSNTMRSFKYYQTLLTIIPFRRVACTDIPQLTLSNENISLSEKINDIGGIRDTEPVKNTLCWDTLAMKDRDIGFVKI